MEKFKGKIQFIIGLVVLFGWIIISSVSVKAGDATLLRMFMGLTFGYVMMRAAFGFAGSANKLFAKGSSRVMGSLMLMFFVASVLWAVKNFGGEKLALVGNPISFGLMLGAFLFGLGMSGAGCCASGLLTDIPESPARGLIVLVFFGFGVMIGNPLMGSAFASTSVFTSGGVAGVSFLDWFKFDSKLLTYICAIAVTAILCSIVWFLAKRYETRRRKNGTYLGLECEAEQDLVLQNMLDESKIDAEPKCPCNGLFDKLFVNPLSLKTAAVVVAICFAWMGLWSFSNPMGTWMASLTSKIFGEASISALTGWKAEMYTKPLFEDMSSLQNVSIIVGSLVALLLSGKFAGCMKTGWKVSLKDACVYIVGGFLMGFGTRLSKGCNGGALISQIAKFSLSGWFFLIFMVCGAFVGYMIKKVIYKDK